MSVASSRSSSRRQAGTQAKKLTALANSQPGRLNFSSAGAGTGTHLAGELLRLQAGVDIARFENVEWAKLVKAAGINAG